MSTNSLLSTKYNTNVKSGSGNTTTDLGNVINSTNVQTVNLNFSNSSTYPGSSTNFNINYPPNSNVAIYDSNISIASQTCNNNLLVNNNVKMNASRNLSLPAKSLFQSNSALLFGGGRATNGDSVLGVSRDGFNWDKIENTLFSKSGGINIIRYNGILYLAGLSVGSTNSNDSFAYSYDGYSWYGLGNIIGEYVNDIAWNGYMWVAVGYGSSSGYGANNIAYSYDGLNWIGLGRSTSLFGNTNNTYGGNGVAWNGYMWVAVGTFAGTTPTSCCIYSYDGINWNVPNDNGFQRGGSCIAWNGNMWVAGGGGTSTTSTNIAYSYDGINWTNVATELAGDYNYNFSGGVNCLKWNGYYWLAGGRNKTTNNVNLIYSKDAITWDTLGGILGPNDGSTKYCFDVEYTGNYWILGAYNPSNIITMLYAPIGNSGDLNVLNNGSYWTNNNDNGIGNSLAIFSERLLCISLIDRATHYITTIPPFLFAGGITGPSNVNRSGSTIAYAPIIPTGAGAPVSWSRNATGSTGSTRSIFNLSCNKVAWNGTTFLAVGGTGPSSIAYSDNGIVWSALVNSRDNTFLSGNDIEWNGNMWVAGGLTGPSTLAYSYDGYTWYGGSGAIFSSECKSIAYGDTMWMAGGIPGPTTNNSTLSYSNDGINWNAISNSKLTTICNSTYWNGVMWVAVGSGTNTIAYSYDGINWTGVGSSIFTTAGNDVAWNNVMWVAVGSGTNSIAYSYNGINWIGLGNSIFTVGGISVTWNGSTWIAIGSGTNNVAYSTNGIIWTGMGSTNNSFGFTGGISSTGCSNKISWTQNIPTVHVQQPTLAFGGTGSTILYSPDGLNWSGLGNTIFTNEGRGGAWNGRMWVAVGSGTNTIAYSYDGLRWIGLGTSIFNSAGNDVAWNGSMWVAVGSGNNSIAYSYDGINWTPETTLSLPVMIGISWNGKIWLAVGGSGNVATSTNGITWTATTPNPNPLNYAMNKAIWGLNQWVAVGTGNNGFCFATSTNGIDWNGIKSTTVGNVYNGFSGGANDIAWNGRRWVAVGDGPIPIMSSIFGSTGWTGVTGQGTGSYLNRPGRGITWNDRMWVAVGGTGPVVRNLPNNVNNTINFSPDGINWNNISGLTGATGVNPFNYGNAVVSNSKIGPVVVDSAIHLNNAQNSNQLSFSLPNTINTLNTSSNFKDNNLSVTVMADWYGYN